MDKIDSFVFIDRIHDSLGALANACLDAYEKYGANRLDEAAYALKAIQCVDLSGCKKCEDPNPLPWHTESNLNSTSNVPIEDVYGNGVIVTDSGHYPPDNLVCESIVSCMNTVYALQQKNEEVIENAVSRETKENPITDDHISGPTGDIGSKVSSEIVEMVIDVIKSHDRRLKDKVIEFTDDIEQDLELDHLDLIECIMQIESRLQDLDPSTYSAIPDDETDVIKTVGDLVLSVQKVIDSNKK